MFLEDDSSQKSPIPSSFSCYFFDIIYKYIFFSPNSAWKRGPTWLCKRAGPSYLFPGKINIKNIFLNNFSQKDIIITSLFCC